MSVAKHDQTSGIRALRFLYDTTILAPSWIRINNRPLLEKSYLIQAPAVSDGKSLKEGKVEPPLPRADEPGRSAQLALLWQHRKVLELFPEVSLYDHWGVFAALILCGVQYRSVCARQT